MRNFFLFAILLSILFYIPVFSQTAPSTGISMEQTLDFLNNKLGRDFKLELAHKNMQLIINFYKNGVLYKVDKTYLETLDSSKVSFSKEEKVFILRCKDPEELEGKLKKFRDGCIEREIIEKNIIGAYGRTNLDVGTDSKKIASLEKAFVHLIKLAQDEEYSSSIPFE